MYPDKKSAIIPCLMAAQKTHGWLSPEAVDQVAAVMKLTPARLVSVASFYDMFELKPVGRSHDLHVHEHQLHAPRRRRGDGRAREAGRREERRRQRGRDLPAQLRVPRRLRHRADGERRRPVHRAAHRRGREDAGRGHPRRPRSARRPSNFPADPLPRRSGRTADAQRATTFPKEARSRCHSATNCFSRTSTSPA